MYQGVFCNVLIANGIGGMPPGPRHAPPQASEPRPELHPVFVLEDFPGADAFLIYILSVGVQGGGGDGACGGAVEGEVFEPEDFFVEAGFGALPGEGGELVGPAELPEGAIIDILFLSAGLIGLRERGGAAEDGDAGALAGVVQRQPAHAAHRIGQPGAELGHVRIGAPGDGHGPPEFDRAGGDGVQGVPHRGGQPRVRDGAHDRVGRVLLVGGPGDFDVLGHVEVRSLVGLAVEGHHLADIDRLLGLDGKREFVHVVGEAEGGREVVEDEVLAVVEVLALGVVGIEILPEDELAFPVPEAIVDGDLLHIGRGHHVLAFSVDAADAGDVGRYGDVVVGDPFRHPGGADPFLADADDFELPDFVLVGDREAFAAVAVAVLLREGAHQPDGVPGVVAALQGDALELFDPEPAGGIHKRVRTAEGGFADGQLLLVEAGVGRVEVGVGMGRLRDFSHELDAGSIPAEVRVHGAPEDRMHGAGLMVRSRFYLGPCAVSTVAGMGCHHGTVGGGLPANHNGRTALAVEFLGEEQAADGQRGQQGEESFHGQIVCPKLRKIPGKTVLRFSAEIGPRKP